MKPPRTPPERSGLLSDIAWAWRLLGMGLSIPLSRKVRFVVRGLLRPRSTARWLNFLRRERGITACELTSGVLHQSQRPFYDVRLGAADRVDLLIAHERFLRDRLGEVLLRRLDRAARIELARVPLKASTACTVILQKEDRFLKEGALVLALACEGRDVLSLAFTIGTATDGTRIARIGCLQATASNPSAVLRELTRGLHGVQPRILLVQALRMLCRSWGVARIEGVGAAHHVYRSIVYRRRKTIQSAYDGFWHLLGGERQRDGNFSVPRDQVVKEIGAYPANERAQRRRRAALIADLAAQIGQSLAHPPAPTRRPPASGPVATEFSITGPSTAQ